PRLARLPANGRKFIPASVAREDFADLVPAERVEQLLRDLEAVNAVRRSGGAVGLKHEALTRTWKRFAGWLDQRVGFRETVQYWVRHRGEPGEGAALLCGKLLREAEQYDDLNGEEKVFIEASRGQEATTAQHDR